MSNTICGTLRDHLALQAFVGAPMALTDGARIAGIKHVHEQRVFVGLVPLGSHPSVDLDVQCPKERPAQSPGA